MKRLIAAVAVAGVVWYAPMGVHADDAPPSTWEIPDGCVVGEMDVVCEEPAPTDPEPPTIAPSTTTTLAPWQVEGLTPTDVCIQHITGGPTLQPGEFEYADSLADSTGTTQRLILPCRPTSSPSPAVMVVSPPVLPATGGETGWIALVALVTLLTGVSIVGTVRRSS
jgi:LPXTG-motif cell wall-anchored protein